MEIVVTNNLHVNKYKLEQHRKVGTSIDDSAVDGAEGVLRETNILHNVVQVHVQPEDTFQVGLELSSVMPGHTLADAAIVASHTRAGEDEERQLKKVAGGHAHQRNNHRDVGFAGEIAKVDDQHGKEIEIDGKVERPEVVGTSEQLVETNIVAHQGLETTTSTIQSTRLDGVKTKENVLLPQDDIICE